MPKATSRFETENRRGTLKKGMTFQEKVTAQSPRGRVATYGDVARRLNSTGYRAVGAALHRNPFAPQVPCHRVVGSDGRLTGFAHGLAAKRRLLEKEGVKIKGSKVDLSRHHMAV
jgi:methylated-DNA-[protein]-cysteine S-methyltransferase